MDMAERSRLLPRAEGSSCWTRSKGGIFSSPPAGHAYLSLGINHYQPGSSRVDYNCEFREGRFGAPAETEGWTEQYFEKFAREMVAIGLNTVGIHNDDRLKRGPYIEPLHFVNHAYYLDPKSIEFPDVFAPACAAHCDAFARQHLRPVGELTAFEAH